MTFRTALGESIFQHKYAHRGCETWDKLADVLVDDVCRGILPTDEIDELKAAITAFKFIPGGRYLYYAGRPNKAYFNCFLSIPQEDTREQWATTVQWATQSLMQGGGIGLDYSRFRPRNSPLHRTGGQASGPLALMNMVNEIGRYVMQGGSRRSAIYASLNWQHADAKEFLTCKNWPDVVKDQKLSNFNFPGQLDMTNVSLNYDDHFLAYVNRGQLPETFTQNVRQALETGEPGFSFNFGSKSGETARNAPVSADTRVLTPEGYQPVRSMLHRTVTVWTGKQWAQTMFKRTGQGVSTVAVKLSNGRVIKCSPEHPFVLWSKYGDTRVAASDLKSGASIVCDLPSRETQAGDNEAYGLGFVWGDGYIKEGRGDIQVFAEGKRPCYEKTVNALQADDKGCRAYFKCKYVNKPFFMNPSFLAGWFDADGSYTRDLLRLSSKEEGRLLEAQEMLDLFGIKSVVRRDGKCNYGTDNPMFTLGILKESFNTFAKHIPTLRVIPSTPGVVRKQNIKVASVSPSGEVEDVYCCDVGVPEHSFMAEGVVISNCTEVTSSSPYDSCNLGSLNMSVINSGEFERLCYLGSRFLYCGTIRGTIDHPETRSYQLQNRRLGLGLMGMHEWLLQRRLPYAVGPLLHEWLAVYQEQSELGANALADALSLPRPVAYRAIAPTGSIGILAGTTTGIEPLFAVAYKRRYLKGSQDWHYQYVVDGTAKELVNMYQLDPNKIETALTLASDYEKRMAFQADVQDYVDMSISSTINLPEWGSELNNESTVKPFAETLSRYAPRLRGLTVYPDGSRGGQPLTAVPYDEAIRHEGVEYAEHDICVIGGKGGTCGV